MLRRAVLCAAALLALLGVVVAATANVYSYSPESHPALGTPAPHPENPNRYVNEVHIRHPLANRHFRVAYDIEHDAALVSLPDVAGITAVAECGASSLALTVDPAAYDAASIAVGALVVAPASFAHCMYTAASGDAQADHEAPVMREVTAVTRVDDATVLLTTTHAPLTQVLKEASISLATNHWGQNQRTEQHVANTPKADWDAAHAGAARSGARRTPSSWFSHAWHAVTHAVSHVVHDVVHAATTIVHTIVDLVTGDFTWHKTLFDAHPGWNYNPSTGGADKVYHLFSDSHVQVDCSDCALGTDLTAYFEVQIEHYHLNYIDTTLTGTMDGRLQLHSNAEFSWSWSRHLNVATIHLPSISFMAGPVPVHITITIPIALDLNLGFNAQATGIATVDVSGSVHAGIGYGEQPPGWSAWQGADSSYGWHKMFVHSLTQSANLELDASAHASASAQLLPAIQVSVDGVADATVSANPKLELDLDASGSAQVTESGITYHGTATGSLYFDLDVELSMSAHIPLIHKSWSYGPRSLYQLHKLLWHHTWSMSGQRHFLADALAPAAEAAAIEAGIVRGSGCANDCNGNGECIDGQCNCYVNFFGEDCAWEVVDAFGAAAKSPLACGTACMQAAGLTTCAQLNGHSVCVDSAADLLAREAQVAQALHTMAAGGPACVNALAAMMCAETIPLCDGASQANELAMLCPSQCTETLAVCGINPDYAQLVCGGVALSRDSTFAPSDAACTTRPTVTDASAVGSCELAAGLSTCAAANGETVHVNTRLFTQLRDVDAMVSSLVADLDMDAYPECKAAATDMLCTEYLPACSSTGEPTRVCADSCAAMMQRCPQLKPYAWLCNDASQTQIASTVAVTGDEECGYARLAMPVATTEPLSSTTVGLAAGLAVLGVAVLAAVIAASVVIVRRRRMTNNSSALTHARLVDAGAAADTQA